MVNLPTYPTLSHSSEVGKEQKNNTGILAGTRSIVNLTRNTQKGRQKDSYFPDLD